MRKTLLTVATLALVLAAFPVTNVGAHEPTELTISVGTPSPDHAGGYQQFDCAGTQLALFAIDVPGCGDFGGTHTVGGFGYILLGFTANSGNQGNPPLTGTTQALLEWSGGTVDFQCNWNAGQLAGCQILSAQWPPVGQTFEFSCQSLAGALGHWGQCFVAHE